MKRKIAEFIEPIPSQKVGIGLRSPYIQHILQNSSSLTKKIGWFEVHSENYYNQKSSSFHSLIEIRKNFLISLHSVGNSLGSTLKLDLKHLKKLKELVKATEPFLISDHISWGRVDKKHLNDLLPLPYSKASLKAIVQNIFQMQDYLGREILVENPSAYLTFKSQDMTEVEFINELTKQTGCGLLLDVNNIFVSATNNACFDTQHYIKNLNKKIVKEIHLAGHSKTKIFGKEILIDTHNNPTCPEVWEIYKIAIKEFGKVPTLVEWDQDFPDFAVLLSEAKKAEKILSR